MLGKIRMELKWLTLVIRGLSEFSATAIFMMISCMGYVFADQITNKSVMSSIVTGLAVVTTMHIFGCISGAHTNPCVSIACYLLDYIRFSMMILYVTCQLAGCAFGYFLLLQMLPRSMIDTAEPGFGIIEPMNDLSFIQIIGIEGFLTATLVFAWCALWDVRSGRSLDSVALRMGCQIAVCTLIGVSKLNFALFLKPWLC